MTPQTDDCDKLLSYIRDGDPESFRRSFLKYAESKYLWNNAFHGMRSIESYYYPYKKEILEYVLWRVYRKVSEKVSDGSVMSNNYFTGLTVNSIREAIRYYRQDVLLHINDNSYLSQIGVAREVERDYVEGYVEGVNPYDCSQAWEKEERFKILFDCLDQMKEPCKTLVRLKFVDDLSHQEIVERKIGLNSVSSSRVKLSQCLDWLRDSCKKSLTFLC